ncbi:putative metalloprotease CJM1_0395 family protein [Alteromonas gracilis]|uniref:putative metalloprotease CJM1_0395 family protein n=1 Tax=Alteromonas gracilis TaxID=1479524 RepID=UPI00373638B6
MNIVTPILNAIAYPTANINTESARRDNVQRETIPQASDAEQGASQKGLGSEADKAKSPGQPPSPVTYDRPQVQTELQAAFQNVFGQAKDNGQDESAGKQNAQDQQQSRKEAEQKQQEKQDAAEIEQLKARDQEVRVHEQAHAATGGQYAGAPRYEYTTGPDNKRYVTDGEVSIDVSKEKTPQETLKKMEQVRAAALAPAEPSSQDLKVAAEASQKATEARSEIAKAQVESRAPDNGSNDGVNTTNDTAESGLVTETGADAGINIGVSENSATTNETSPGAIQDSVLTAQSVNSNSTFAGTRESDESEFMQARIGRIQNAYLQAYTPSREGLSFQA